MRKFLQDHEGLVLVAGFIIFFGLLAGIGVYAGYLQDAQTCRNIERLYRLETDTTITLGCMVKYEGRWVDRDVVTGRKQEISVRGTK
jgi:hypothetical protein